MPVRLEGGGTKGVVALLAHVIADAGGWEDTSVEKSPNGVGEALVGIDPKGMGIVMAIRIIIHGEDLSRYDLRRRAEMIYLEKATRRIKRVVFFFFFFLSFFSPDGQE